MVKPETQISQWLQQPLNLKEEDEVWLKEQIEKYPWCFVNYALLAKLYTDHQSFLQPKFLKLASVYTSNRKQLYNFINATVSEENEVEQAEEAVQVEKETPKATPPEVKVSKEHITETPVFNESEQKSADSNKNDLTELEVEGKSVDTDTSEKDEDKQPFIVAGKPEEAEITESDNAGLHDEEEKKELASDKQSFKIDFDEIVKYDPLKELKPLETKQKPKESLPLDQVVYNPEVELSKLIEEKEEAEESGKQDFTFWLNHLEDEESEPKEETSAEKVQDLLDKFLATKRRRPIQTREFYNPESKAEKSEEDNMDVISETLAQLYVTQKHYVKAIEAYQKLSLQNPNKSATFAARIKELEKLIE